MANVREQSERSHDSTYNADLATIFHSYQVQLLLTSSGSTYAATAPAAPMQEVAATIAEPENTRSRFFAAD